MSLNPFGKTETEPPAQTPAQQQYNPQYLEQKVDVLAATNLHNPTSQFWQLYGDQLLFHFGQSLIKPLIKGFQKVAQNPQVDINQVITDTLNDFDQELCHDKLFHDEILKTEQQQNNMVQEHYQSIPTTYSPAAPALSTPPVSPPPTTAVAPPSLYSAPVQTTPGQYQAQPQASVQPGYAPQQPAQGYPPQQAGYPPQGQPVSTQDMATGMADQTKAMGQNMAMGLFANTMFGFNNMANQKMNAMAGPPVQQPVQPQTYRQYPQQTQ